MALIAASAVGVLASVFILKGMRYGASTEEITLTLVVGFGLLANFIYLLSSSASDQTGRIGRLFGLWIQAKEADLKNRINPAHSPDSGSSAAVPDKS